MSKVTFTHVGAHLGLAKPKGVLEHAQKCTDADSSHACAKSHPGIYSPLEHSM